MIEDISCRGEVKFISAIIEQAIGDAQRVRNPREPRFVRVTKREVEELKRLSKRSVYTPLKNFSMLFGLEKPISAQYFLLFSLCFYIGKRNKDLPRKNLLLRLKEQRKIEIFTYKARLFLRKENELFCYYCNLIALEPECVEKAAWKTIKDFDDKGALCR